MAGSECTVYMEKQCNSLVFDGKRLNRSGHILSLCIPKHQQWQIPPPTDSKGAEEATEAAEASLDPVEKKQSAKGAFTEHIFSDPLGAQHTAEALANYSQR